MRKNEISLDDGSFRDQSRAYLARAEARLSTMHRIAGVFVSGAGLLVLLPLLFKDALSHIAEIAQHSTARELRIAIWLLLAITMYIAVYAVGSLIKGLVLFYFAPQHQRSESTTFLPRFALSALALPQDGVSESVIAKRDEFQLRDMIDFLIPRGRPEIYENYEGLYADMGDDVFPDTRTHLLEKQADGSRVNRNSDEYRQRLAFLVAMGVAGIRDRTLIEEVARMEISLARHANNLRQLVLRYFKSFLLLSTRTLLLATLVPALALPVGPGAKIEREQMVLLFLGFFTIAALSPLVLRLPLLWLKAVSPETMQLKRGFWDNDIMRFERHVVLLTAVENCIAGAACGYAISGFTERGESWHYAAVGLLIGLGISAHWRREIKPQQRRVFRASEGAR